MRCMGRAEPGNQCLGHQQIGEPERKNAHGKSTAKGRKPDHGNRLAHSAEEREAAEGLNVLAESGDLMI